ncbi:19147_t:CDS:2 [Gigaspora margarita]|uniref:19147_t:CDS:1 n=1 Tax=Gigaspora margarita TaxID=4874 RepID=A0ABN7VQ95_GIGMA|nr:19147_t:CDS:2 [Gigaspora margarita]
MAIYLLVKQKTCRIELNHLRNLVTGRCFFNPKNDIAFKKIFGVEQNKSLLLSFLNSILRQEGDNMIEEVELLTQELPPQYEDSKKIYFRCFLLGQKYIEISDEPPNEVPGEIQEAYRVLERHHWSLTEIEIYEKTMIAILNDEDTIRTFKNEVEKKYSLQDISDTTGLSASKFEELSNQ